MGKKRARTLEDVLFAGPVEKFKRAHPEMTQLELRAMKRFEELQKNNPSYIQAFNAIDQNTLDGKRQVCRDLNITLDELQRLDYFQEGCREAEKNDPSLEPQQLIRSWRSLKGRAKIQNIDAASFPKTLTRPMLVLFSADWCPPCRVMRPTFARLVPFFDKADVRYHCPDTDNWEWAKSIGVSGVPTLVAFFPDGTMTMDHPGMTAHEIWHRMNGLVTSAPTVQSETEHVHVCEGDSCRVVPREA